MSAVLHLSSAASGFKGGNVTPAVTPADTETLMSSPAFTPGFPEDLHMNLQTILIIIIFCIVCLLLLVAFFYTFCFQCTIHPTPKDGRQNSAYSLDREDATFRRSSSSHSVGNTI